MLTRIAMLLAVAAASFAHVSPARAATVVRCESHDYQQNYCHAQTHRGVRLVRQISHSDCKWDPLESTCRHASLSIL